MGEYAKFNGHEVKIGTCEDLYYLRADQAARVQPLPGNVNPMSSEEQKHIRFRFPWPDEDDIQPGAFRDYDRGLHVHGVAPPSELEHHSVQFTARAGYVVSLPCPEGGKMPEGVKFFRNGFPGPVKIVQQAYRNGHLATVCACGGCGARYNLPTVEDALPLVEACAAEADNRKESESGFWRKVALRIAAGYRTA